MKKTQNLFMKFLAITALCFTTKQAISQTGSLNMKKAIELAMANNYSLKADSMDLLITDYQNKTLKADFLPQVNYSTKAEYNPAIASQILPGYIIGQPGKDYVSVPFGSRYTMGSGIEVTQNLIHKSSRIKINASGLNNNIAQSKHNRSRDSTLRTHSSTSVQKQPGARPRNSGVRTDIASSLPSFVMPPTTLIPPMPSSP